MPLTQTVADLFPASPLLSLDDDEQIADFGSDLLNWFAKHKRVFPWRRRKNPYAILLAEKLLQQTLARQTVVDAWRQLLALYPTPRHLAKADVETLEEIIRPLGFLYRARELPVLGAALVENTRATFPIR